jgi:hypothetical protein
MLFGRLIVNATGFFLIATVCFGQVATPNRTPREMDDGGTELLRLLQLEQPTKILTAAQQPEIQAGI